MGIVGPGSSPSPRERPPARDASDEAESRAGPRRFVVPSSRRSGEDAPDAWMMELRRLVREAGIVLAPDQISVFLFDPSGGPVRRPIRFRTGARRFEAPDRHPERMAREVTALLSSVSRVEVADLRQNAPPPGAMRDYLTAAGIRAFLSIPLRFEDRIVGFLAFENTSSPRRWTAKDRERAHESARRIEALLSPEALARPLPVPSEGRDVQRPYPRERSKAGGREPATGQLGTNREGRSELRARLPRLRPLEGAALVASELGREMLRDVEVQAGTLRMLEEDLRQAGAGSELLADLRELSARLRSRLHRVLDVPRVGMAGTEVVELGTVLAGMSRRLAGVAGEEVRFVVAPCVDDLPVRAAPELLERALLHLVRNARSAVRRGGRIRLSWARAVARAGQGATADASEPLDVARIQVEDNGSGIRPAHLPWVFEPYFTTSAGDARRPGLGLPTVQALVEGHGGWVDLHSRPGEGTMVVLNLPLAEEPASRVEPETDDSALQDDTPSVLIVEDDPLLSRFLKRVLVREGFRVRVAESVGAARRAWNRSPGGMDLVMIQRRLSGGGDARSLAREWRRERTHLPVVLVDRPEDRAASDTEVPDFEEEVVLADPYDPATVVNTLRRILPESSGTTAATGATPDPPPPPPLTH